MDLTLIIFVAQLILSIVATISSIIFLTIVQSTHFPLHVKTIFFCLIIGSGMISFGHLGIITTEFTNGAISIYSGDGVVWWGQLVNAYGLSLHPMAFFILSLDRLVLVVFPSLLKLSSKYSRQISFLIVTYCVGFATAFTPIVYYTRYGFYLTSATLCVTLSAIPISLIGYILSRTRYRRTVAVLKLNARYELSSIRELTRVVYPIAILYALLTSTAFISAVFVTYRLITPLTHNRIYRNTLSLQSLLTTWLFLIRHRDFKRRLCYYSSGCRRPTKPQLKVFLPEKTDPITVMHAAWKMRTAT